MAKAKRLKGAKLKILNHRFSGVFVHIFRNIVSCMIWNRQQWSQSYNHWYENDQEENEHNIYTLWILQLRTRVTKWIPMIVFFVITHAAPAELIVTSLTFHMRTSWILLNPYSTSSTSSYIPCQSKAKECLPPSKCNCIFPSSHYYWQSKQVSMPQYVHSIFFYPLSLRQISLSHLMFGQHSMFGSLSILRKRQSLSYLLKKLTVFKNTAYLHLWKLPYEQIQSIFSLSELRTNWLFTVALRHCKQHELFKVHPVYTISNRSFFT